MSDLLTRAAPRVAGSGPRRLTGASVARWGQPRTWTLLLVACLVLVPATWVMLRPGFTQLTHVDRYPGTAPGEWGPGATWASPPLLGETRPVPVGGSDIVLLTAERRLVLVGGADGTVRWDVPLPDGEVHTPPAPTRVAGAAVLGAHIGDRFVWWSLKDGQAIEIDVPAGSTLSMLGEAPLVAVNGTEAMAVVDEHPTPIRVPTNTKALAAHEDGTITAAGSQGWWHLGRDGSVGSKGDWESRSGVTPTVGPYTGGFILLIRPGDPATLEIHADRTTDVRFVASDSFVLPGGAGGGSLTWMPSPSGTWGIFGRTLVDLRASTITDLGAWSTQTVTADRAYGHIDGQTVVVGPAIPRGVLAPGEAIPDVVTANGALVRGPAPASKATKQQSTGGGIDPRRSNDVAYFLPPRRTAS